MAEHGRLIDADALKESIRCSDTDEPKVLSPKKLHKVLTEWIDKRPTIEERKTGKWQWLSSTYDRIPCELRYQCSECHHETIFHSNQMSEPWEKYCPNCGAYMKEGNPE